MNRPDMRTGLVGACVLLVLAGSLWAGPSPERAAQIEADWLRQEALREKPGAARGGNPNVTTADDAAGGVDGVKTGKWGFHTAIEKDPWWQVDLGEAMAIDRIVLWNRCDACGERNTRIIAQLSHDGKTFRQAWQNDGKMFYGQTDKKPLTASLGGQKGRFLRLTLKANMYLHLDEVEVFAAGRKENVALKRPCEQSSTSEWSASHLNLTPPPPNTFSTLKAIERGLMLADNLRAMGVDVREDVKVLEAVRQQLEAGPADAEAAKKLFLDARWAVRRLAWRNPQLDFDSIVFVQAAPGMFPHMSDQNYGWWSRPGGGVYVLEGLKSDQPRLRCLTEKFEPGSYNRLDLSYDGKRVLFAYCKHYPKLADLRDKASKKDVPEDAFYHLYEMNLDGTDCRRITRGRYDDFDGRYLGDGDIAFLSTRKGRFLQTSKAASAGTLDADLGDSYVRCGGDNYRPVPVFTLHRVNHKGEILPISAFENFEWTPSVSNDGYLLYARWDYIDRFNGHFFSLWSTNPDGTNAQLVYGNYTVRPQVVLEARSIPNSHKLIFTASAHHSITGGSLCLLDRSRGTEADHPIARLTPEVPFPETEAWAEMYYANPWPLSEEHYLCAWSDRRLPPHCRVDSSDRNPRNALGLYLYDAFGNLNLIYRDAEISSQNPIPVRPRPRPPLYSSSLALDGPQEGSFLLQDVYEGLGDVERGTVKSLRIVAVPPKWQPHMNSPNLGVSREDPGKFVLGTAPVEEDGSAYFRVPSGVPVFFQALDAQGRSVQTMRSLTYVQPGQTLSCIGCHESRDAAPPPRPLVQAARRAPSRLQPGPDGSWPLRYDTLVQPVLDKHCVSCHQKGYKDAKAAAFDLRPPASYDALLNYADKDLNKLAFEKDMSHPLQTPSYRSKLWAMLSAKGGHEGVRLDADSRERFLTWMDTYAHRLGHFTPQQEEELKQLRLHMRSILVETARKE